jgi:hypothetical protein
MTRLLIRTADERDIPSVVLFLDNFLSSDFFMTAGVVRQTQTVLSGNIPTNN